MTDFVEVKGKKAARPLSSWAAEESSEDEVDDTPVEVDESSEVSHAIRVDAANKQ